MAHEHVRARSVSICETRPELNHATNSLAIIGRRDLTRGVFLDRRAFLNSYDPKTDSDGSLLAGILSAVVPVCGGINLEYYFSRVDNQKFGAGTKLPHNVVGLFAVANGTEGDLKTGLPYQMIDLHEPIRLMIITEQAPEIARQAITKLPQLADWLTNRWVHLVTCDPESREMYLWNGADFEAFAPEGHVFPVVQSSLDMASKGRDSLGVLILKESV